MGLWATAALELTGCYGYRVVAWQPNDLGQVADEECAICLCDLDAENTRRLACGHFFCHTCVTDWFNRLALAAEEAGEDVQQSGTCPTCRQTAEDAADSTFCAPMPPPREVQEVEEEAEEVEDDEAFARAMAGTLAANAANDEAAIVLPAFVSANSHRANTGRTILNASVAPPTRRGGRQPSTKASAGSSTAADAPHVPHVSELHPLGARAAAAANPTSMQAAPPAPHSSQSVHGSLLSMLQQHVRDRDRDRGLASMPVRPAGSSKEATDFKPLKARLCTYFFERGHCAKGERCTFSHSADQLRSAASGSKGKGQMAAASSGPSSENPGTLSQLTSSNAPLCPSDAT
jgi:hypothetical protein